MNRNSEGVLSEIPISESILPRPVWIRLLLRKAGAELTPPDEVMMHDAILVLEDEQNETWAPELWREAFRVFEEASRTE